ncbi:MAG: UvrD-helicase domain-containing protein [Candidatus Binataceae bacterium]
MSELRYRRPRIVGTIPLDRHTVIEAGAGTGKTFTLENLIVEILVKGAATIDQILAVTFTEKAAGELRARIRSAIQSALSGESIKDAPAGEIELLDSVAANRLNEALLGFDRAPIHTIHSFCRRTLAEFAMESKMRFQVEPVDGESAFREAFRAELRENLAREPEMKGLLEQWLRDRSAAKLEELLALAHRRRYSPGAGQSGESASFEAQVVNTFMRKIAARMKAIKLERGVLDYDDMLEWLAEAIAGPDGAAIAAELRTRYRFALIDEFQDTDETQWAILKRVFLDGGEGNVLYVIGDPRQAIYGFRNADVYAYFAACGEMEERHAKQVTLRENFRSTAKLIAATNAILDQDASPAFFSGDSRLRYGSPVTCGRDYFRAVDSAGAEIAPVRLMTIPPGSKLKAEQARGAIGRHIARTIRKLLRGESAGLFTLGKSGKREPVLASDIFVLTRTNSESAEIGGYLRAAGVPFAFYKRDGLFQTREAGDIADALRGAMEPGVRARRLKAWATPFFAVPYDELPKLADLPPAHPLAARLYEWKSLADGERFAELFDAMVNRSGLAERELFLAGSERELTNYLHIFEILLEQAAARRLSLGELIELLGAYIAGRALPPGEDSNVQRIESERNAVQVMTMHRAKGLEADVVFIFGGTHRSNRRDEVAVYHEREADSRRFAIGKAEVAAAKDRLNEEEHDEWRRLMYVAITRARAKLFLPYFPKGSTAKGLTGVYQPLNDRLIAIAGGKSRQDSFEIENVLCGDSAAESSAGDFRERMRTWRPPPELLSDAPAADARILDAARARHAPLAIRSYTSIGSEHGGFEPEDFKIDPEPEAARDIPGGREVGIFLHEAIEKLDWQTIAQAADRDSWMARGEVRELFARLMRRHGVTDQRWFDRGREIVWNALASPAALGGIVLPKGIRRCRAVREMEFSYPIPESNHRLLGHNEGGWRVGDGYMKGIVDIVFEHAGLAYFADWKSDALSSYEPDALAVHVARSYATQAQIYAVGVVRLLGIRDERAYRERFGGIAYVFLRGIVPEGEGRLGVHFIRPSWNEIVKWESALTIANDAAGAQ